MAGAPAPCPVQAGSTGTAEIPGRVQNFAADLKNQTLAFSGIYEDGWVCQTSSITLAAPAGSKLVVEGGVPPGLKQRIEVLVDGTQVAAQDVNAGGSFSVRANATEGKHKIDLRFASPQPLPGNDGRLAAARLSYVGFHIE